MKIYAYYRIGLPSAQRLKSKFLEQLFSFFCFILAYLYDKIFTKVEFSSDPALRNEFKLFPANI